MRLMLSTRLVPVVTTMRGPLSKHSCSQLFQMHINVRAAGLAQLFTLLAAIWGEPKPEPPEPLLGVAWVAWNQCDLSCTHLNCHLPSNPNSNPNCLIKSHHPVFVHSRAHHGQVEQHGRISNACARCNFFTPNISEWHKWDGHLPEEHSGTGHPTMTRLLQFLWRNLGMTQKISDYALCAVAAALIFQLFSFARLSTVFYWVWVVLSYVPPVLAAVVRFLLAAISVIFQNCASFAYIGVPLRTALVWCYYQIPSWVAWPMMVAWAIRTRSVVAGLRRLRHPECFQMTYDVNRPRWQMRRGRYMYTSPAWAAYLVHALPGEIALVPPFDSSGLRPHLRELHRNIWNGKALEGLNWQQCVAIGLTWQSLALLVLALASFT